MKKLIITSALFAFVAAPVFAQSAKISAAPQASNKPANNMNRPPMADKIAERQAKAYQAQYKLSDDQYKGVYDACLEFARTMETKRNENKQMNAAEFKEALDKRNTKMKSVMTAEQYKAFEATQNHSMPAKAPEHKN